MIDFYTFSKITVRSLAKVVWRTRVYGSANVPKDGPLIVACNHVSYLDPPLMASFCPRRISYMAKKELFEIPVLGTVIRALGAYPVDREGSATAAVRRSLSVLEAGGAVGIFPEGTRNRDGTVQPQTGVALLAALAKAPVVPAYIAGSGQALRFHRITVSFGPPLSLPAGRKATREELAKFTGDIMNAIGMLAEKIDGNT